MTHAFAPMSARDRASFADRYLSYLREREGVPCLGDRTLSRREEARAASRREPRPALGRVRIDPRVFARNLPRCEPEPGLDRAMLWALAVAKGNRAERLGVETKIADRGFDAGTDDPLTYVELQECYHTRVLLDVLSLVGLDCDVGLPVGRLTRAGVRLFARLPRAALDVLALPFEVVGIAAFAALRDEARELFADAPALSARIDALFTELLVDEIGHVHFLRSRLGRERLAFARALLPFAQRALFDDNHEVRSLLARRGGLGDLHTFDPDAVIAGTHARVLVQAA
jgi:hypothetical protein